MRVYFVGSHSTGKTTMARYVSRKHNLPMITEVARAVLAELELDFAALRTDIDKVGQYQDEVFKRQVQAEKGRDKFVSDRAFDNLAYAAEHSQILPQILGGNEQSFKEYAAWVSHGIVFFLRPHKALLTEDGVRESANWDAVVRIDGMVKFMLEQFSVPYLPIETSSMQERAKIVDYVLTAKKPPFAPPAYGTTSSR